MNNKVNAEIITEYINSNGLTNKEFCRQCNISLSTFYRIVRGGDFNLKSLFRVAKKINLPLYKLFK